MKGMNWKKTSIIALIGIVLTSCGNSEAEMGIQAKNSPAFNVLNSSKNTASIWSFDLHTIVEESGVERLDLGVMLSIVKSYTGMINDSTQSGIDFSEPIYVSTQLDQDSDFDYAFAFLKVTNKDRVRKFLKAYIGTIAKGTYDEGEQFHTFTSEDGTAAKWDNEHLVLVFTDREKGVDLMKIADKVLDSRYTDAPDNEQLSTYLSSKDDFNCLINLEQTARLSRAQGDIEYGEELLTAYKDGFVTGHGNFEQGEMVFSADVDAENLKNSAFNIIQATGVSQDLIDAVSADYSINVGGANLQIDGLFDLMEEVNWNGFSLLGAMKQAGLSKEDLKNSLTGEFSFSMMDVLLPEKLQENNNDDFFEEDAMSGLLNGEVEPELVVGLKLKDPELFARLMSGLQVAEHNGVWKIEEYYMQVMDNNVIVASNRDMLNRLASKSPESNLMIPAKEMASPLFGYFNTNFESYGDQIKATIGQVLSEKSVDKLWMAEKISANGNFDHFEFRVKMKDSTNNALGTFVKNAVGIVLGMDLD